MMIKKILMLLAATGLLGACSSDEEARVTSEPVPIWLSAAVEGSQTRAATTSTTGDEVLLGGQDVDAYIKVKGGDWVTTGLSATVPRHFSVGTSGKLERKSGEAMDYYPMDGTPVSIYAVHPSIASAATFTVQSDQTDDANYAASDLSYSKTADYNRSESPQTLTFGHVLSKIIVNVQTDLGTVNSVKLRAKKSTTLTYPANNDDGYTLGTASGVGMIEMNAGGAAIIPPQTTAAVGDVRIIVEIDGKGTFVYNFLAGTTFASNTEYTYTVKIGASITVTSSISAWGYNAAGTLVNADDINNKTVQIGRPKLPIEYVIGTHNMQTATTMADDDDPRHSAYFSWNNTVNNAGAGPKSDVQAMINGITIQGVKYHLPSIYEWMSILPPYYVTSSAGALIDVDGTEGDRIVYKNGLHTNRVETVGWGVTNNNGTYSYDVYRRFNNDYYCPNDAAHTYIGYALRFKETTGKNGVYTCAYRYEYKESDASINGSSLNILVNYVGCNQNITIETLNDETAGGFWSSPDFTFLLPACGDSHYNNHINRDAGWYTSADDKKWGVYYSSTQKSSEYIFNVNFKEGEIHGTHYSPPGYGLSMRLFKDAGTP